MGKIAISNTYGGSALSFYDLHMFVYLMMGGHLSLLTLSSLIVITLFEMNKTEFVNCLKSL